MNTFDVEPSITYKAYLDRDQFYSTNRIDHDAHDDSEPSPNSCCRNYFCFYPSSWFLFLFYAFLLPISFFTIMAVVALHSDPLPSVRIHVPLSEFSEHRALTGWMSSSLHNVKDSREFGSGRNAKFVSSMLTELKQMRLDYQDKSTLKMKVIEASFLAPIQKIDDILVVLCDNATCDHGNTSVLLSSHVSRMKFARIDTNADGYS